MSSLTCDSAVLTSAAQQDLGDAPRTRATMCVFISTLLILHLFFFCFFAHLCVSFFFCACAVTVAGGQRLYSHHRQNFIATAVAAALLAEARLSLPSSVPLHCGYLLQKTHNYFSFTCGSQTLKRQKVNETFWTRRRLLAGTLTFNA